MSQNRISDELKLKIFRLLTFGNYQILKLCDPTHNPFSPPVLNAFKCPSNNIDNAPTENPVWSLKITVCMCKSKKFLHSCLMYMHARAAQKVGLVRLEPHHNGTAIF